MKINKVIVNRDNYNTEINCTSRMSDTAILRQALENQSEEHTTLTKAVNELIEAIESKNTSTIRNTAFGLINNIGSGTIANILGSGALEIIERFAKK